MNIVVSKGTIRFRNPQVGQPTKAIKDHYNGRRIIAYVEDKEKVFGFSADELPFEASEEDIVSAIETRVLAEKEEIVIEPEGGETEEPTEEDEGEVE